MVKTDLCAVQAQQLPVYIMQCLTACGCLLRSMWRRTCSSCSCGSATTRGRRKRRSRRR